MKFQYEGKLMLHNFIITDDSIPNVLSRDVLKNLCLNWENLFSVFVCKTIDSELNRLTLSQYTVKSKTVTLKNVEVDTPIDPKAKP